MARRRAGLGLPLFSVSQIQGELCQYMSQLCLNPRCHGLKVNHVTILPSVNYREMNTMFTPELIRRLHIYPVVTQLYDALHSTECSREDHAAMLLRKTTRPVQDHARVAVLLRQDDCAQDARVDSGHGAENHDAEVVREAHTRVAVLLRQDGYGGDRGPGPAVRARGPGTAVHARGPGTAVPDAAPALPYMPVAPAPPYCSAGKMAPAQLYMPMAPAPTYMPVALAPPCSMLRRTRRTYPWPPALSYMPVAPSHDLPSARVCRTPSAVCHI